MYQSKGLNRNNNMKILATLQTFLEIRTDIVQIFISIKLFV